MNIYIYIYIYITRVPFRVQEPAAECGQRGEQEAARALRGQPAAQRQRHHAQGAARVYI